MADDVFGIVGTVQAGSYRVERVVAEGGFGVVYRAQHAAFRAPVALKCLKVPEGMAAEHQQEFLEKFRAEGEMLFRLSAALPAVVRPLHVDALRTADGRFVPFMALEWLTGQTLAELVVERQNAGLPPLGIDELVELLQPIGRALGRAHRFPAPGGAVSIVHRDLKPENLFIADVHGERVVKILDFGIAKARSAATQIAGRQSHQQSQLVAFSPNYAAPEQWVPKRFGQTGPWTDVFGLAITMVEVMAARMVLVGDAATIMAACLDERTRPSPRTFGVAVPDAVEAVFVRALAVDPRRRHADAGAFWDDLEAALGLPTSRETPLRVESEPPEIPSLEPPPAPRASQVEVPRAPAVPRIAPPPPARPAPAPPFATPTAAAPPASGIAHAAPPTSGIAHAAPLPARPSSVHVAPLGAPAAPAPPVARRPAALPPPVDLAPLSLQARSVRLPSWMPPAAETWVGRMKLPLALLTAGVLVTLALNVHAAVTGNILYIGPVRLTWIGALLSAAGLGTGGWRLVNDAGR